MQDNRLRDSLGYALVRVFRQVNREHGRAVAAHGITAEQAHVLLVLWLEGPQKVGELQRFLALSSGTLTGALDRLEAAGLVRRRPDPDDRRAFRVEPVAMAARRRHAIEAVVADTEARCFGGLRPAERARLLKLLHKVSAGLAARSPDSRA